MTRNQNRRVEIACPVRSAEIRDMMTDYLNRILADNTKAWRLLSDGTYLDVTAADGEPECNVQSYYMEHPIQLAPSIRPRQGLKGRLLKGWRK